MVNGTHLKISLIKTSFTVIPWSTWMNQSFFFFLNGWTKVNSKVLKPGLGQSGVWVNSDELGWVFFSLSASSSSSFLPLSPSHPLRTSTSTYLMASPPSLKPNLNFIIRFHSSTQIQPQAQSQLLSIDFSPLPKPNPNPNPTSLTASPPSPKCHLPPRASHM